MGWNSGSTATRLVRTCSIKSSNKSQLPIKPNRVSTKSFNFNKMFQLADFWRKFLFLMKSFIFDENFYFWWKFLFLIKIFIFDQNFHFGRKFLFFITIFVFEQNFYFWWKFSFLTRIFIFHQNFYFWRKRKLRPLKNRGDPSLCPYMFQFQLLRVGHLKTDFQKYFPFCQFLDL